MHRSPGRRSRVRVGISKPTVSLALQSLSTPGLVARPSTIPTGQLRGSVLRAALPMQRSCWDSTSAAISSRRHVRPAGRRPGAAGRRADRRGRGRGSGRDLGLTAELVTATGRLGELIGGAVVGVPGVRGRGPGPTPPPGARTGGHGLRDENWNRAAGPARDARERHQPRGPGRALGGCRTRRRRLRVPVGGHGCRCRPGPSRRAAPGSPRRGRRGRPDAGGQPG